ncbi:unnamed protein product, partial [Rotaria sp. Silwood1]
GINLTALREIKHSHVTELLESFEEYVLKSPRICLVFEFMNTDLENIINNNLHNNWILHQDLKPINSLINKRDVLKITDFGLHPSPELLLGTIKFGTGVDIWAVGLIMPELLH